MSEKRLMPIVEDYNKDEEFLYNKTYLFIKGYAVGRGLKNTLKALPFIRFAHNGQYRKGLIEINGQKVKLPYILHVLKVCSTLISLGIPFDNTEEDILLTAALLHDCIEDRSDLFPKGGIELVTEYGFPKEVCDVVKLLSKETGATEYELSQYFNGIKMNKFALLIKLSDRSHNVESLYCMKVEKIHKYVKETRDFIYPLSSFGKQNYPELSNALTILKAKILSLTELTETLVAIYEEKINGLHGEISVE